jgi:hypothetical protein
MLVSVEPDEERNYSAMTDPVPLLENKKIAMELPGTFDMGIG